MNPINEAASLLTFFSLLIIFKKEVQKTTEDLFEHSKPSAPSEQREFFFYVLFFWAVVASLLGGLFWNVFFNGTLGGSQEPHGWAVVIWSITTNITIVITLLVLNDRYSLKIQKPIQIYIAFLIGSIIGSIIFYNFPFLKEVGFRHYFETISLPYLEMEFWLVIIWSSVLTIPGFLMMGIANLLFIPSSRKINNFFTSLLKQSLLSVGLTTSAVSLFLWAFDDPSRFESARGIIAGLFLRITIFFGLFIGSHTEAAIKKTRASKGKKKRIE